MCHAEDVVCQFRAAKLPWPKQWLVGQAVDAGSSVFVNVSKKNGGSKQK